MKHFVLPFALLVATASSMAQDQAIPTQKADNDVIINFSARGSDVRYILFDIFSQAKKNFLVQDTGIINLFLNVQEVPFGRALDLVCSAGGLEYSIVNDVYIFSKAKKFGGSVTPPSNQTQTQTQTSVQKVVATETTHSVQKLDETVLNKRLTVRMQQAEIRKVFAEIGKQVGITIEVAHAVKNYKVNAFLIDTSLRFALNSLTQSASLAYLFTDHGTISIAPVDASPSPVKGSTLDSKGGKLVCPDCNTGLVKGWKYCPMCGNYVERMTKG